MLRLLIAAVALAPLSYLSEAVCDFQKDANAWPSREAFEATFAGQPKFTLPPIGSGFNRSLNIDGFCNDILWKSSKFACNPNSESIGEFRATATSTENGAQIHFDNANCPLSAISIRKTEVGAVHEAEIRFEFEWCKAAAGAAPSPVSSAAVVMGLRKLERRGANLLPWMKEVCNVATTTPAVSELNIVENTIKFEVGAGQCKKADGTTTKKIANIVTPTGCEAECKMSIDMARATGTVDSVCSGYAFSATAPANEQCIHYNGQVLTLLSTGDKVQDATWQCFNMSLQKQDYTKTQEAQNAIDALPELTQNLHLREAMAGSPTSMTTAKLYEVKSDENCFSAAWWFMLQDDDGNPASLPVFETEWDALMDMIPDAKPTQKATQSTVIVDRVLAKTCNPDAVGWVGHACVMPKLAEKCNNQQLVNAIVTGVVVPILGWFLVYLFFSRLPNSCMISPARDFSRQDHDTHDEGNIPTCKLEGLIACCLVAVIVCGGLAFGSSTLISYAFGANGCKHGTREMMVIGSAAGIPGAFSLIVGLLYAHFSGHKHRSKPMESGSEHKLILVNPDILHSVTSTPLNSHMASQPLNSHMASQHQDPYSAMQSQRPGGSMMSTGRPGGE